MGSLHVYELCSTVGDVLIPTLSGYCRRRCNRSAMAAELLLALQLHAAKASQPADTQQDTDGRAPDLEDGTSDQDDGSNKVRWRPACSRP